jgi:hypothetical protein
LPWDSETGKGILGQAGMTSSAACICQHGIAIWVVNVLIVGISYEVGLGVGQAASKEWQNISKAFRLNVGWQIFIQNPRLWA